MSSEKQLLGDKINEYKVQTFSRFAERLNAEEDNVDTYEVSDADGKRYQIEISIEWDEKPDRIRIIGFINSEKPWWKQFVSTVSDRFVIDSKNQIIE